MVRHAGAVAHPGRMVSGAAGGRSGYGVHGAVLEAGVGDSGTMLEAAVPAAPGCRSHFRNPALGASQIQPGPGRTQERFCRCRASGEALAGAGVGAEFRTGPGTTAVAQTDAQQAAVDSEPGTLAEPTGVVAGRSPY